MSILAAACNSYGVPLSCIAMEINATLSGESLKIGAGDRLEVRYPFKSGWDQQVSVRSDGCVSLLGVGELEVRGMSVEEVQETISRGSPEVPDTEGVTVNLMRSDREIETSRAVYVIGEVTTPGAIRVETREISFLEAIATAGGTIKETGHLGNVYLVRTLGGGERRAWHIDARQEYWTGEPVGLMAGDIVMVPNTAIDDVDIWVDQYIRRLIPFPYLVPTAL